MCTRCQGENIFLQDCVAHDVYHNTCFSNFRSDCQIPQMFWSEEPARKQSYSGRHNNTRLSAFDNAIQYLDTLDSEQVTVRDLVDMMAETFKGTVNQKHTASSI